jgi:hypothetical protein
MLFMYTFLCIYLKTFFFEYIYYLHQFVVNGLEHCSSWFDILLNASSDIEWSTFTCKRRSP